MQRCPLSLSNVLLCPLFLLLKLFQFGLFHGDPHPGNVFAMPDGRIAYVDFGNVAELSERNKVCIGLAFGQGFVTLRRRTDVNLKPLILEFGSMQHIAV